MLAYQISGKGKPVVLLHAFPLNYKMWDAQVELLKATHTVITPDLPGFGESSNIRMTSLAQAAQLVNETLDHAGVSEPIFLGGLSMGGYIAFEFYRQFPKRVGGLGLFSTRAAADSPEGKQKRFATIEFLEKQGVSPFIEKTLPGLMGKTTLKEKSNVAQSVEQIMRTNSIQAITDALRAMANRADSTPVLAQITCPTLILCGDEDPIISKVEHQGMQQKIKSATLHVLSPAGHLINLEQPEQFNALLKKELTR